MVNVYLVSLALVSLESPWSLPGVSLESPWSLPGVFQTVCFKIEFIYREFPVKTGFDNWRAQLKTQFPKEEHAAIDKYFKLIAEYSTNSKFQIMMKLFPLWIAKIICSTPLVGLFTKLWTGTKVRTL